MGAFDMEPMSNDAGGAIAPLGGLSFSPAKRGLAIFGPISLRAHLTGLPTFRSGVAPTSSRTLQFAHHQFDCRFVRQ